jgi:zinc protease
MKLSLALVALLWLEAAAPGQELNVDIPYKRFVLQNGLTLIVHEDHKAPIVAVNVWYHVGSKNEKPGKTGFAHLFEHLMFGGSENVRTTYINAFEKSARPISTAPPTAIGRTILRPSP